MAKRITGQQLNKEWGIGVAQARYREDGKWYHPLKSFPGAYCDAAGYIIFETEADYRNCPFLQIQKDVHVPRGIENIPGYVQVDDSLRIDSHGAVRHSPSRRRTVGPLQFSEGATRELVVELRSRDRKLKAVALERYGASCVVCNFNFGEFYGDLGEGFIELHHLKPISVGERSSSVEDVAVVCPNCHRMLHRRGAQPISIQELKDIIASVRSGNVKSVGEEAVAKAVSWDIKRLLRGTPDLSRYAARASPEKEDWRDEGASKPQRGCMTKPRVSAQRATLGLETPPHPTPTGLYTSGDAHAPITYVNH